MAAVTIMFRFIYAAVLLILLSSAEGGYCLGNYATKTQFGHCSSTTRYFTQQTHIPSSFYIQNIHSHTCHHPRICNRIKSSLRSMGTTDDRNEHPTTKTNDNTSRWKAGDFESDYNILKTAMAKQSAMSNLQQRQRQHILDYGFARNRRPLVRDFLKAIVIVSAWTIFLTTGASSGSLGHLLKASKRTSWLKKIHVYVTYFIINCSRIHHWIVGMMFPLCFLVWARSEHFPSARVLEEYFKPQGPLSEAPKFFYTSELAKKRSKDKDTGDHVLCLVENWSSAVGPSLAVGLCSCILQLSKRGKATAQQLCPQILILLPTVCRLLSRLGGAASLHQYPSLLFELRRSDQPRPLCRPTAYMQRGVALFLNWLPLGIACDLAVTITTIIQRRNICYGSYGPNIAALSLLAMVAPISHLIALLRIIRVSRCSAISLSEATSFQDPSCKASAEDRDVKWRYQLRWRTPKRISETLKSWMNYLLTGHAPLLSVNDWKDQPLRVDEFATEGAYSLFGDRSKANNTNSQQDSGDDLVPYADSITESLSLIFRDRDAAIHNATQARYNKHQESYDAKTLDDVLGIAVQQTFGIGLSYDFEHFDSPNDREVSIHQLRARMAKSAVRRKRELDREMKEQLEVLHRLHDNVVTLKNKNVAEGEMKVVEEEIRNRNFNETEIMKAALLGLIPTNALAPSGDEYENPIMVAEYVDLTAPFEKREFKATVEPAPDSLSTIEEYVRRDFGDEAADAYRQEEIAHRRKEQKMLKQFRERYGELKDE